MTATGAEADAGDTPTFDPQLPPVAPALPFTLAGLTVLTAHA